MECLDRMNWRQSAVDPALDRMADESVRSSGLFIQPSICRSLHIQRLRPLRDSLGDTGQQGEHPTSHLGKDAGAQRGTSSRYESIAGLA